MKTKIKMLALLLTLSTFGFNTQAAEKNTTRETQQVRVMEIKQRVDQVKAMDISSLNRVERKDLKHELRDMNKEMRTMEPYVYISAGALILVIILLIILL